MKTCVVSAPTHIDLSVLSKVLRGQGYRVVFPFELSLGADIQSALSKAVDKADLCIFVLAQKQDNSNVLFEIGYAKGLQKSILIIRENSKTEFPYLQGFATISSNLEDEQALSDALGQAIRQIRPRAKKTLSEATVGHGPFSLAESADKIISQLRSREALMQGYELEVTVLEALRQAGVQITSEAYTQKRRPDAPGREYDAAIWVDDLQDRIKNPLMVEIRKKIDLTVARKIHDQFLKDFKANIGGALLILYVEGPEKRITEFNSFAPLVLYFRVEALLNALKSASLAEVLWRQRNRLAHGV